jgi:hypothetical protein
MGNLKDCGDKTGNTHYITRGKRGVRFRVETLTDVEEFVAKCNTSKTIYENNRAAKLVENDELLTGRRQYDTLRRYTPRYTCIDGAEMAQPQWSDKLLADHIAAGCRVHKASVQSLFPDQHTCSGGACATLLLMLLLLLLLPYCLLPL